MMFKKIILPLFLVTVIVSLFLFPILADNGNRAFPQHTAYYSGVIMPQRDNMDSQVQTFYNSWAQKYILDDPADSSRKWVDFSDEGKACVSEGQGYGMVITAIMGDKTNFDGLYKYYLAHPSKKNSNFMAWKQEKNNGQMVDVDGADSATDGDLDAAYALLLADKQWGSAGTCDYLGGAQKIINALVDSNVDAGDYRLLVGDWAKGGIDTASRLTRSSDFMLDYFRVFANYNSVFNNVKAGCEAIIKSQYAKGSAGTGLMPDFWVKQNGSYEPASSNVLEGEMDGDYAYNACRVPWRFAINYIMTGDASIYNVLTALNNWIKSSTAGNPEQITDGYYVSGGTNGEPISGTNNGELAFIAPFMVSAMISSENQEWLNQLWDTVVGKSISDSQYYGNTIKLICMIIASGNWWAPDGLQASPAVSDSVVIATAGPDGQLPPETSSANGVTFYQDASFGGNGITLGVGSYTLAQLTAAGIPNDWMSSLKVPVGYTVEVYQNDNFTGNVWSFTADASYVGDDCNDQMSSVKITGSPVLPFPSENALSVRPPAVGADPFVQSDPVRTVTTAPITAIPWTANTEYRVGNVVAYNGKKYICRQTHTTLEGWEPAVTPALWLELTEAENFTVPLLTDISQN